MTHSYPSGGGHYAAPNSSMAVISLVAGIMGITLFPFLGSIIAVITGSMAKSEIRGARGALSGEGVATAGIVLGWIGILLGVVGICFLGVTIALPFCMAFFIMAAEGISLSLPALLLFS
jgi:hypothetical protein